MDILSGALAVHQILSTPDPGDAVGRCMDNKRQYTLQEFMVTSHRDPCHPLVSIAISSVLTFIRASVTSAISKVIVEAVSDNARVSHFMVFQWRSPIWAELLRRGWCPFELSPMSLQRLSRYVRNLGNGPDIPVFRLHTICVPPDAICKPPGAAHERELQDLAIAKTREAYGRSTATLVLDAWLLSTSSAGMTDAEEMMRIFSCTWISRLWTYQEGALPEALYFQLEGVAEDLDQMKARLESEMERDLGMRFTLGERLLVQHNSLRGFRELDPRSEDFILYVLGIMAFRPTSVVTDEALCLSTLLGLDMDAMLSIDVKERMAAFWRQVPCARSSLLLASIPTLDEPGLSWAPYTSLLVEERLSETGSLNTLPNISLRRPTTLTTRGLEIEGPGLLIRCDGFRPVGEFLVQDDYGFSYHVKTMLHKTPSTGAFQEAVAVLVVHGYDRVHHCVERDGTLQPLLLMQPHADGLMIGHKIGMAVIRCLIPRLDAALLRRLASYGMFEHGVVGDAATQKLQVTMGRNLLSESWCVA
ncbi:hypothetical protein DL765_007260 [Monosporascus sp. GIB2]|nr:hypothetical protein DL765_007260 [Monosporascus sp. GIB2]